MPDNAQFNNDILDDLQKAVGLNGDSTSTLLYYDYGHFLEGRSLINWKGTSRFYCCWSPDVEPNNAQNQHMHLLP